MKTLKTWAAAAALVALAGTAQAGLVDLGNGTVKDDITNLIWLQDWYFNGPQGEQNWATQKAWAEGLTFAGSSDWRLPSISEYSALYTAYGDLTSNTLPFVNVVPYLYWSGTEYSPGSEAWGFYPVNGSVGVGFEDFPLFAVAVRPGDVAAPIPEPQTWAMLIMGLGVVTAALRRRPS